MLLEFIPVPTDRVNLLFFFRLILQSKIEKLTKVILWDKLVSTYSQGDVVTAPLPYTPRIPASSNCRTFQSADLYGAVRSIPPFSYFLLSFPDSEQR
jgi:hypothetical protein